MGQNAGHSTALNSRGEYYYYLYLYIVALYSLKKKSITMIGKKIYMSTQEDGAFTSVGLTQVHSKYNITIVYIVHT